MLRDLRHALRSLAKTPGFVLVAALCLGLALALNTTTFAILDALLHPTLPVERGDELHDVILWGRGVGGDPTSWEVYSLLRQGTFFQEMAFWDLGWSVTVRAGSQVDEELVPRVSRNLFPMLGVRPESGRLIDRGAPDNVALVSHDVWERSFGGAPLNGLRLWVGAQEYRVIGVLPPDMTFPFGVGIWIPVPSASEGSGAGLRHVFPIVRVRRGTTGVTQQLAVLAARLRAEYGTSWNPYAFSLRSILPDGGHLYGIHFALAGAAVIILLIACVNLASLMLVRGVAKRRELALRLALGAGRATLVRQLLAEGALITAVGAVLGIVLTVWAVPVLHSRIPDYVVNVGRIPLHPSWRVFIFALGLAGATLLLFGLWPALRASDVAVSEPLKENSAAAIGRRRWRYSPLVIGEVALSLVLLMAATLLVKAAERESKMALGYDRTGLWGAWITLQGGLKGDSVERVAHQVLARVRGLPGVRSAAALGQNVGNGAAMSEAYDGTNGLLNRTHIAFVTDGFFPTIGLRILDGRDFLPGDERDSALIVDAEAAQYLWPDGHAVGRLVKLGGPESHKLWHRVVGVVPTALLGGPPRDPFLQSQGAIYVAWRPRNWAMFHTLVIRTGRLNVAGSVALREGIRDALPSGGRLWSMEPWGTRFDSEMRAQFFLVKAFGSFSAFALLLAATGLYGVVSYGVTQRMREFAVRLAVGAPPSDVVKLVTHDAAVMVLAGTGIGAFAAMWASSLLGDWLWTVYHTDAVALVIAEAVLLLAGLAAALQPALRALRASPVEILRAI
jgi:putative ABC transport system permease protein